MRPPATLSLDLDDKWSYLQTRDDPRWQALPSFLALAVERLLTFTARHRQPLTVFVVGQDAALPRNGDALRSLVAAGHEIGNHSFHHESWGIHLPEGNAEREIADTEAAIQVACGIRPSGFRGPGFRLSPAMLDILAARGYRYDASTCPNVAGPLAGLYFDWTNRGRQLSNRSGAVLYGSFAEALRPLNPYRWHNGLLELPVSTAPFVRLPVHGSYLFYLATFSPRAANAWFYTFLRLCRATGTPPSFLLHSVDFLGADDDPDMDFFPGMKLTWRRKIELLDRWIEALQRWFEVTTLQRFVETFE